MLLLNKSNPVSDMPILWRYLLSHFLKVLLLCVIAFIAVLMTTRLDEIANFATLGPESIKILYFIFLQIPYILPIAIPVSGLISSLLLTQKLSNSHELTAFRSCGISIRHLLTPLLIAAALLGVFNFYVVSELATQSHFLTGRLKKEMKKINPLFLLSNKHIMRMKGGYYETLGTSKLGEKAGDAVLALPDERSGRIRLILARKLKAKEKALHGREITLISANESRDHTTFDDIVVENIGKMQSGLHDFARFVEEKVYKVNHDHLKFSHLLLRIQEQKVQLSLEKSKGALKEDIRKRKNQINTCYSEIFRRLSTGLVVFSFTLLGLAFGIKVGRHKSNRGLFLAILLAACYLACYFTAKGFDKSLILSTSLYLVPHILIVIFSVGILRRVSKGVEG